MFTVATAMQCFRQCPFVLEQGYAKCFQAIFIQPFVIIPCVMATDRSRLILGRQPFLIYSTAIDYVQCGNVTYRMMTKKINDRKLYDFQVIVCVGGGRRCTEGLPIQICGDLV